MVTLSLLRHAKSKWGDAGIDDFDRPLAPRGLKAAPAMGRFMQANAIVPDLVLCSPARRTRQTLDLVLPFLEPKPEIRFEDDLYPFAPEDVLDCLQQTANGHAHIMLIGHNPGMQSLGSALAGAGDPALRSELAAKFPTCGLAVLAFETGWQDLAPSSGTLRLLMAPKRLPD